MSTPGAGRLFHFGRFSAKPLSCPLLPLRDGLRSAELIDSTPFLLIALQVQR
jgi:hypothetical protein